MTQRQLCVSRASQAANAFLTDANFSISWPGCGAMVFWQLGVLKGLSKHIDTSMVPMVGSSSGALVTALAACGVRPEHAAGELERLLSCESIRKRRLGLVGVLGALTRTWLGNCLPDDAGVLLSRRSTVLVTQLPLMTTTHITNFESKQDVVDIVMASAHLPLLLDGNWYAVCRQRPVIDGGFWWWWHRCEEPYRISGGRTEPLPPPPASLQYFTDGASSIRAEKYGTTRCANASLYGKISVSGTQAPHASLEQQLKQQQLLERKWWSSQPPPPPPLGAAVAVPPPPVSYSCPTSFLDFIAADVQRFMVPIAGVTGGAAAVSSCSSGGGTYGNCPHVPQTERVSTLSFGNWVYDTQATEDVCSGDAAAAATAGGASARTAKYGVCGQPGCVVATPAQPQAPKSPAAAASPPSLGGTAPRHGKDLCRGYERQFNVSATADAGVAASNSAGQAGFVGQATARVGNSGGDNGSGGDGDGGGDGTTAVLLVQPSDDDALTAGWRRYRRWRPDDLSAAWEMMHHGEVYGSGALLRRLEKVT